MMVCRTINALNSTCPGRIRQVWISSGVEGGWGEKCAPFGSDRAILPRGTGQFRGSDHLVERWPARLGRCTARGEEWTRGRKGAKARGQRCLPTVGRFPYSVRMIRLIALLSRSLTPSLENVTRPREGVEGRQSRVGPRR